MLTHSIIRYPGSKAKLYHRILDVLPDSARMAIWATQMDCYCEPFVGTGAVGWAFMSSFCGARPRILINDRDLYIGRLWTAVRDAPTELIRMVQERTPEPDDFDRFKALDGSPNVDPVVSAYRKLVLHNTSFSGMGAKAGSRIGGKNQKTKDNYLSRWNPLRIATRIQRIHALMRLFPRFDICNLDFADVLAQVPDTGIVYLDPPFYQQGKSLYRHSLTDADHVRLAGILRRCRFRFILSYDDDPRIRDLYSWASVSTFSMTPTISAAIATRRTINELLIANFDTPRPAI
jgi:DNA adenine methylase